MASPGTVVLLAVDIVSKGARPVAPVNGVTTESVSVAPNGAATAVHETPALALPAVAMTPVGAAEEMALASAEVETVG